MLNPVDAMGRPIQSGDLVMILDVPDYLWRDLPEDEQAAIRSQKGKTLQIANFDEQGYVELEFGDDEEIRHTIWLEPSLLEKQLLEAS